MQPICANWYGVMRWPPGHNMMPIDVAKYGHRQCDPNREMGRNFHHISTFNSVISSADMLAYRGIVRQ